MAFKAEAGAGARVAGALETRTAPKAGQAVSRTRVPLGTNRKRLSYELRLWLFLLACVLPAVVLTGCVAWALTTSPAESAALTVFAALAAWYGISSLFRSITRPLQTLANVVAALREQDFSFRARGARRGDSLGDLALEINSLANMLQAQRAVTRDALTLAERVMEAMGTPVLAFAADGTLRLLNPAAEAAFSLKRNLALGRSADALGLQPLFSLADGAIHSYAAVSGVAGETRWSLRRSTFRLGGVPHQLFVLSDVQQALREEERTAWQRLIRVLSHEINNSLTPISSIAGSLRMRLGLSEDGVETAQKHGKAGEDLRRGLELIEDRALSLHRFLQAYQQLTRLPQPMLQRVPFGELVQRTIALEPRVEVQLKGGPSVLVEVDPGQVEQLMINLLHNAAEAALHGGAAVQDAFVGVGWAVQGPELVVRIEDNGPGLSDTANLFVPFYTTKPEGTGIGLVLAKQIVAGHGGALSLSNRQDAPGCVAEVRFPLPRRTAAG